MKLGDILKSDNAILSLSVRRAWIEILKAGDVTISSETSLSVRRAWIEICEYMAIEKRKRVALREESVD